MHLHNNISDANGREMLENPPQKKKVRRFNSFSCSVTLTEKQTGNQMLYFSLLSKQACSSAHADSVCADSRLIFPNQILLSLSARLTFLYTFSCLEITPFVCIGACSFILHSLDSPLSIPSEMLIISHARLEMLVTFP